MVTRMPASQHSREGLTALIEGRLSTASAKNELVKLATRLIVEEALEGEAGDGWRDYYEHGALPGRGYRNGYCTGRLKTAEGLNGRLLLSKTAVSQLGERLWEDYQAFAQRDLSEYEIVYLFVDGIADGLAPNANRFWRPGALRWRVIGCCCI